MGGEVADRRAFGARRLVEVENPLLEPDEQRLGRQQLRQRGPAELAIGLVRPDLGGTVGDDGDGDVRRRPVRDFL